MKKYSNLVLVFGILATMTSCGGNSGEDQSANDSTDMQQVGFGLDDLAQTQYAVPSPNELFLIIKSGKLPFHDGLIDTEQPNYSSSKAQALNFGKITADIAYTASYEKFQESMDNFENLRKVGNDLGISYVFDEIMVNRVKSNMDNPDSLEIISTSSYQNIIAQLEENQMGAVLSIISAGGFVESVYILTHLIDGHDSEDIMQRLADQKLVMENVLSYLDSYSDDERVKEVINELAPIADVYLNLKEEVISEEKIQKNNKVILGGSRVLMTKEDFAKLKDAATNYRNSFSNAQEG